jgi:hypothetical protein
VSIVVVNTIGITSGYSVVSFTGLTFTGSCVTKIAGDQFCYGHFRHVVSNGLSGGIPIAGFQRYVPVRPLIQHYIAAGSEVKYTPISGSINGAIVSFCVGSFFPKLNGSLLASLATGTPAVTLPVGLFSWVIQH